MAIATAVQHSDLDYCTSDKTGAGYVDARTRLNVAVVKVTLDTSYPTGGEAIDFTSTSVMDGDGGAFTSVFTVVPHADAGGYAPRWDHTNSKLMMFEEEAVAAGGPLLQVADTTDLDGIVVYCVVYGL